MICEGSRIYGDRSTYKFVNESRFNSFSPQQDHGLVIQDRKYIRTTVRHQPLLGWTFAVHHSNCRCGQHRAQPTIRSLYDQTDLPDLIASTTSGWEGWNMKIKISDIRFQWEKVPFSLRNYWSLRARSVRCSKIQPVLCHTGCIFSFPKYRLYRNI
jgi:hypothetical protein